MIVLNVQNRGMGDAVYISWIVQGLLNAGEQAAINPGRNFDVARLFNIPIEEDIDGIDICSPDGICWKTEMTVERKPLPRPTLWSQTLGISAPIARPSPVIRARHTFDAAKHWGETGDKPRILLFPRAAWPNRIYPLVYWHRIAWTLEAMGFHTLAMDSSGDRLKDFPRHCFGFSLPVVSAMMLTADLVVANESGPAHLAGTLDVPTLGIIGALDPRTMWGHMPSVVPISSKLECVGCHWQPEKGYRPWCAQGCEALFSLPAVDVIRKIVEMTNEHGSGSLSAGEEVAEFTRLDSVPGDAGN